MKNLFPPLVWRLVFAAALVAVVFLTKARAACDCAAPGVPIAYAAPLPPPQGDSWVFARARYTHDPASNVRVAQYEQIAPVEPLPDQRAVSSGYARSRTVLRGADGSVDTYYRVQNYGNGRGGMDAEWERFHDAWRGSTIAGGNFAVGFPGYGFGGFPGGGFPGGGFPGGGFPGGGYPGGGYPGGGYGYPGYGHQPYPPGTPDPRLLDPDGADGFYDQRQRTPDSQFFNPKFPKIGTVPAYTPEHHGGHGDHDK